MAFSPDHEAEVPLLPTEAEITLKKLLDKQLSTTGRLEQVEFQEATESMHCIGHGSCGVSSLAQFLKNESAQIQFLEKTRCLRNVLHGKGFSKDEVEERCQKISCFDSPTSTKFDKGTKRKRYGADPLFISHAESENLEIAAFESKHTFAEHMITDTSQTRFSRHSRELEASLLRGKDKLKAIAHLSGGGSACRKPLISETQKIDLHISMTPQERARVGVENESVRLTGEVFSKRAPAVLELHSYLNQRSKIESVSSVDAASSESPGTQCEQFASISCTRESELKLDSVEDIPEQEILRNRLSDDEIRRLPCGKFASYSPGNASQVLYIRNLSTDVTEADLVALFARYQGTQQRLLFRLMKRGRMKGQAFVTFSDKGTSSKALQLINGYKLKGKPMVIEFGHGGSGTVSTSCE